MSRDWVHGGIARIEADFTRSADTHLIRLELPASPSMTVISDLSAFQNLASISRSSGMADSSQR